DRGAELDIVHNGPGQGGETVEGAAFAPVDLARNLELVGRTLGHHVDGAADGAAAIERALRTAQHFNALDVHQFLVEEVHGGLLHPVDDHGEGSLAALHRGHAAKRNGLDAGTKLVDDHEVRREGREILDVVDARTLDG